MHTHIYLSGKLCVGKETRPASIHDNVDNVDGLARVAYERRIERLEQENKELSRKLVDTSKTLQEVVSINTNSLAKTVKNVE